MRYNIIADSSCDLTDELRNELGVVSVPLSMILGEKVFVDDDSLDVDAFVEEMKEYQGRASSSCPSPEAYGSKFLKDSYNFVITLSSRLSGSYASAMAAKALYTENAGVHVFDSKSASAGQVLVAVKLGELIRESLPTEKIIEAVEKLIAEMKTYFVLESLDTFIKNGRIGKVKGKLLTVLGVRPVMGSDGDGNIALYGHGRGQAQVVEKLLQLVRDGGRETKGQTMVIGHCKNPGLAQQLKDLFIESLGFARVLITSTGGLSSLYANEKGIVFAY